MNLRRAGTALAPWLALSLAGCCFGQPHARTDDDPGDPNLVGPTSAGRDDDADARSYDEARAAFTTTLVVRAPSPQEFGPVAGTDATSMTYESGGLSLPAFISEVGSSGAGRPAVLFLHGGFAFSAEDWEMSRPFRDAGFVVMTPILRGENGAPGVFTLYLDEVDDVVAAGRALAASRGVDASRVFVTGHSSGGTLAMLAAMHTDVFRAGTSLSGYPETVGFVGAWADIVPYDPEDVRESRMRSPLVFARSFRIPFRAYYGTEEPGHEAAVNLLVARARASGRDVDGAAAPGDHFTAVPEEIRRSIAFFEGLPANAR